MVEKKHNRKINTFFVIRSESKKSLQPIVYNKLMKQRQNVKLTGLSSN